MNRSTTHLPILAKVAAGVLLAGVSVTVFAAEAETGATTPNPTHFAAEIVPFVQTHCVACHSGDEPEGGIRFDRYRDSANIQSDFDIWERAARMIRQRQMPPADQPQPATGAVLAVTAAIEAELNSFDCSTVHHPGRVTLRRLNKAEYNNTIRDLVGLDLQLADDFPADDVGNGFDNIGDVLSIPPVLFEKYLAAAETVAERVIADDRAKARILVHQAPNDQQRVDVARRNIQEFASRAFRRPITLDEQERLFAMMKFAWDQDSTEDEILQTVITAILANPHFLFRVERDPAAEDEDGIRELDGFELATRMSYFLWSSMPDERLFELARGGELTAAGVMAAEAKRMLADAKSQALVDNFAGQWLQLRDIVRLQPDREKFPAFDDELRAAMQRETELFFETMIRENRSVLELLDADFTFVNQRLARHYGIEHVSGAEFERVALPAGRRGVLTHAGILMLTSNPTRTSPVKRGKWILENILAEPPPPPPADVPELDEGETLGSLREQMEQHRANPACAVCHTKMDAIGFGLENFDAIGAWRDRDGRFEIDASGQLPGGRNFHGAEELVKILAEDNKVGFCRSLDHKMLTYALGRGLTSYDRCAVNEIVAALEAGEYRFEQLVTAIVTSEPFTQREARPPE